jgi:hypothetical protein
MSKTGPGPMPAADPVREWAARPAGEPAVSGGLLGQQCLVTGRDMGGEGSHRGCLDGGAEQL